MQRIILADNQIIFRTGVARVLSKEPDLQVVAQCADLDRLKEAIESFPASVVLFSAAITQNLREAMGWIEAAGSKSIIVLEHGAELDDEVAQCAKGIVRRSVGGPQLIDFLHRVAAGERIVQCTNAKPMPLQDRIGARVLARLTPKEVQIIALVADGCKNKQIATALGTGEQMVKNYLRVIYDKTGVSDRLELAVFTVNHPVLAEAAEQARALLS
jgi:DNA-binding NarL/FixJ family response regulator